ncbi:MAG TPA: triple tyrosine motif-containing protein [Chryseosolibacter sp.]|nr:triple tyrosine motif-containing protein [Chryseosolibacter sp.]
MKRSILLVLLAISSLSFAQTGNYFLSNYSPGKDHFNNLCFDMAQDMRGIMYFATQSGVLEFDGKNWDMLRGESAVYALHIAATGDLFWAGAKGFGKIDFDADGFQHLSFISHENVKDVFQIVSVKDEVYFLKEDAVYQYDISSGKISTVPATDLTGLFTNIFELFGAVYVNTIEAGLYKIENGKFVQSKLSFDSDVVFTSRMDDQYVIGTTSNKLWLCDELLQPKPLKLKDQDYVDVSVVISGSYITKQLIALGTLRGGVIFLNPETGETNEIVNYDTGLPDNEVFALMSDQNKDVWVAHDYGFSRIAPFMPLRSFGHFAGLKGNLLCAYSSRGATYVGTSLGLYKIQKEDVYEDIVYYVDVEVPQAKSANQNKKEQQNEEEKNEEEEKPASKKKGLFSFLKRKKNRENEKDPKSTTDQSVASNESNKPVGTPKFRREKRTEKVLRTSQSVYKKVNGIDAKVNMILEINGSLIAAGLGGVYEVNGLESRVILEQPVRFVYASEFHNMLFASTYNNEVESLIKTNKGWNDIPFLEDLDDQIDFIFEGGENEVWLCGLNDIYQVEIKEQKVENIHEIEVPNPDIESTFGVRAGDNIIFANGSGFYNFDHASSEISRIDSLPSPLKYFASEGHIFYRDAHGWHVSGEQTKQSNLQLLNLFPDLRFISSDQEPGNFWMISGSNGLYKFFSNKLTADIVPFPVFVKSIVNDNKKTGRKNNIHLTEEKSAVIFEIVQPDFVSPDAIEFRYLLEGMSEKWSDWSSKSSVDFPYLPPGDYKLLVQSKNVFDKITDLDPVRFEVLPPYWKRAWFYAMEFSILSTLVLLSFRLNYRYRIISRILSLLTIILLIEFIQTLISSTIQFEQESPVIDFIIQVCIAGMILPVEGFLRNLMLGSLNKSSKLAQMLVGKPRDLIIVKEAKEFQPADED